MFSPAIIHFTWMPPALGMEWVQAHRVKDDWSLEESATSVLSPKGFPMLWKYYGENKDEYEPLKDNSGLFRELAAVELTPEAISAFATRYGPLTRGQLHVPVEHRSNNYPQPPADCKLVYSYFSSLSPEGLEADNWEASWHLRGAVSGDSLATWTENIRLLRALIAVWESIGQGRKAVARYAEFSLQDGNQTIVLKDEDGPIGDSIRFDKASKVTIEVAAEHALIDAIAKRVRYANSISLYPPESIHSRKLAIVPRSLRDAIWLQFGLAVLENKKYRSCEICGKPFEVSPGVGRTNKTLCSPACKARAHRQRRDQALALAKKGVSAKDIAQRLGSQLSAVKKWIAEKKE